MTTRMGILAAAPVAATGAASAQSVSDAGVNLSEACSELQTEAGRQHCGENLRRYTRGLHRAYVAAVAQEKTILVGEAANPIEAPALVTMPVQHVMMADTTKPCRDDLGSVTDYRKVSDLRDFALKAEYCAVSIAENAEVTEMPALLAERMHLIANAGRVAAKLQNNGLE